MSNYGLSGLRQVSHRVARLWAALAVAAALSFAVAAGPAASKAHASGAEYFCYEKVGAYGNCFSAGAHLLTWVRAYGYEHSACSNAYLNGFVTEWKCAPTATWSNAYFDGTRNMVGVVHNNTGSLNQLWGYQEYN